jgi:hypothetical protein
MFATQFIVIHLFEKFYITNRYWYHYQQSFVPEVCSQQSSS